MQEHLFPRWLIVILAVMLLLLATGGGWFYTAQKQALELEAEQDLQAIASLKVDQISNWRDERLGDAHVLMKNQMLAEAAAQYIETPDAEMNQNLSVLFYSMQESYSYNDVLLVDTNGQVVLSLSGYIGSLHEDAVLTLEASLNEHQPVISNLHQGPRNISPHIDIVAPFYKETGEVFEPVGAVILQSDARQFLYPLIQSWPMLSDTAETLLVQRDGDDVLFLNDLRHRENTALNLRIPLGQADLPASMAVLGQEGVVQGVDYRGVEVLAALHAIPDTPWFMVAKIDEAEALSVWRLASTLILSLLFGLTAAAITTVGLVWQVNQRTHFQTLFRSEAARRMSEARHSATLLSVGDGVIVTDLEGKI
ncbi:MAG: cache domain-containing protein, partial [Anaerolineales bacterium]|nr:cache domain-containing protein [Anaerolineales bacterium]